MSASQDRLKQGASYAKTRSLFRQKNSPQSRRRWCNRAFFGFAGPVGALEEASHRVVRDLYEHGEATVGVHLDLSHLAPAFPGTEITAHARLIQVNGRKLKFEVRAFQGSRELMSGTHDRVLVKLDQFMASVKGLPLKLHAEQLSSMGGAELAARYGALSCDHIEHLTAEGIAAMKATGTQAVLLPGAYYFLRDTQLPPIEALRQAGVPMAVSTDHNPGTSPALSLLLMMNMASTIFRLTVPEAIAGVTCNAAKALGIQDSHGSIAAGRPANFILWPCQDEADLVYWIGQHPSCKVVRQGRIAVNP